LVAIIITWSVVLGHFGFKRRQILGHGPLPPLSVRQVDAKTFIRRSRWFFGITSSRLNA